LLAADYAIAQFRYLEQLLLVHGRFSYKRITMLIKYCFYKNYVFGLCQLWFGIFNKFSGQTMFDTWMLAFYNLLFTSLPILVYGVLDKDVRLRTAKASCSMIFLFFLFFSLGSSSAVSHGPV
jgi:magnesium-transporting ATPase (P-type)